MKGIKEVIWYFLFVSAIECYEIKILDPSAQRRLPITHNHTRQLLEWCFSDQLNPVVIHPNLLDIVDRITSNVKKNVSVILIRQKYLRSRYRNFKLDFIVYPSYPTFIISAAMIDRQSKSLFNLQFYFDQINYWNPELSSFLVIGNTCSNALRKLITLLKFDTIKTYYICPNDFDNGTNIYTLNPYANRAPKPWQKVEGPNEPYSESTLFKMSFINDAKICSNITFDKTEFLDGHKTLTDINEYNRDSQYKRKNVLFYNTLFSAMNLTQTNKTLNQKKAEFLYAPERVILSRIAYPAPNIIPYYAQEGYIIVTQKQSFIPTFEQLIDSFLLGKE